MRKVSLIVLLFVTGFSHAQFGQQQVVDDNATTVKWLVAGDIDGDNDLDIAASLFDKVVWYENLDGLGNFGSQNVLVTGLEITLSVALADLDGDLDLDVLITSFTNDSLLWLENLDRLGSFGTARMISNTVQGADHAIAADLDGDDDLDVICASDVDNIVAWFENTDGLGTFGPKQIITSTASGRSVFAGDIDGDMDLDIVSNSNPISATISWYANLDGLGTFGSEQIIAPATWAVEDIYVADLDGDADLDVLSATTSQDRVAWHENLDGLGTFGPQIIINDDAGFPRSVFAADLDNDLDIDVLSAGSDFNENISWYENTDGIGTFGLPQQIEGIEAGGIRSVYAADLDGDGDQDVIGALLREDKVTWYENLTILGVHENDLKKEIVISPNPTKTKIFIENNSAFQITAVKIYDVLGRLVLEETEHFNEIHIAQLNSGLFLLKIETEKGVVTKKLVKE